jgi:hypothetical protein
MDTSPSHGTKVRGNDALNNGLSTSAIHATSAKETSSDLAALDEIQGRICLDPILAKDTPVTQQWRYMNTMPEKLSALQLGDFDGDGVCDVAPRTRPGERPTTYSKSGTSPWIPLP